MAQTDALRPYQPAAPTQLGEDRRYLRNELDKLSASTSSIRDVMQGLETSLNTDTANIATNTTGITANTTGIATNTSALSKISNNPALEVQLSANQTGTSATWTKVALNTVTSDVYSGWSGTLFRYTPPAGVYIFVGQAQMDNPGGQYAGVWLQKNGGGSVLSLSPAGTVSAPSHQITDLQHMNGTDYVELFAFPVTSGASTLIYAAGASFLKAFRLA